MVLVVWFLDCAGTICAWLVGSAVGLFGCWMEVFWVRWLVRGGCVVCGFRTRKGLESVDLKFLVDFGAV